MAGDEGCFEEMSLGVLNNGGRERSDKNERTPHCIPQREHLSTSPSPNPALLQHHPPDRVPCPPKLCTWTTSRTRFPPTTALQPSPRGKRTLRAAPYLAHKPPKPPPPTLRSLSPRSPQQQAQQWPWPSRCRPSRCRLQRQSATHHQPNTPATLASKARKKRRRGTYSTWEKQPASRTASRSSSWT